MANMVGIMFVACKQKNHQKLMIAKYLDLNKTNTYFHVLYTKSEQISNLQRSLCVKEQTV